MREKKKKKYSELAIVQVKHKSSLVLCERLITPSPGICIYVTSKKKKKKNEREKNESYVLHQFLSCYWLYCVGKQYEQVEKKNHSIGYIYVRIEWMRSLGSFLLHGCMLSGKKGMYTTNCSPMSSKNWSLTVLHCKCSIYSIAGGLTNIAKCFNGGIVYNIWILIYIIPFIDMTILAALYKLFLYVDMKWHITVFYALCMYHTRKGFY